MPRTYFQYKDEHYIWLDEYVKKDPDHSWGKRTAKFNKKFGTEQSEPTLYQTFRSAKQGGKITQARKNIKSKLTLSNQDYVKVMIIPDMHVPYHDERALNALLAAGQDWKPDLVVQLGDLLDFYGISFFDKSIKEANALVDELYYGREALASIRAAFPTQEIHMIKGNHENRWNKHLRKHSPEFYNLLGHDSFTDYLELDTMNIQYHEYDYLYRGFQFTHGEIVRKYAGYTAKAQHEKSMCDGAMGHTHRMGMFTHTYREQKSYTFIECGHLFKTELATYITGNPNWQQGGVFAELWWPTPDHLEVMPQFIKTVNGETVHNGRKYAG